MIRRLWPPERGPANAADEAPDGPRGDHVQAGGGFVEEHHGWAVQNRARDGDTLPLPRRELVAAPVSGRVSKLTAAKGGYAQTGQSLMGFVPHDLWVTANFKETQLTDMRPGQGVDISIDAYPDHPFRGHVDSLQAGSGAAFSLLPPENATGNYVKVVQRVPVKIVLDEVPNVSLGPGMSVAPRVRVR